MKKVGITVLTITFISLVNLSFATGLGSEWDLRLHTAVHTSYLSPLEKEVIFEINKLRSNPARYARDYIEPLKKHYKGKLFYYPGDNPLKTKEGVKALYECVRELKRETPKPLVSPDRGLSYAARYHVQDQSKSGRVGHYSSNRAGFRERIEKYGKWNIRIAENIAYGNISAKQIVIYLLIDDGIYSRGHRKNFLQEDFRKIGVATGSHPYYENMCVMDFAGAFQIYSNQ